MALEMNTIPSKLTVAFDSLNSLSEQEHEHGYVNAFVRTINCVGCFVERNVRVEMPTCVISSDVPPNMLFGDVVENALTMGRKFYYLDTYEVILVLDINGIKCKLKCYSDPVVFTFEVIE